MFSKEWNKIYKSNLQLNVWPWTELVSLVKKYKKNKKKKTRILELGCGTGSNIPFLRSLKYEYYSIEGSSEAVKKVKKKYPELSDKIVVGDFTKDLFFKKNFDIIIDRGSLTHNNDKSIKQTLESLLKNINKGGLFIGIDWFSKKDSDFKKGIKIDSFTKTRINSGKLMNVGAIHFTDIRNLRKLFKDWKILEIFEKTINYYKPNKSFKRSVWTIVAKKK